MNTRAEIVAAITKASTLQEQITLVEALDEFDRKQAQAHRDSRSIELADAIIDPTMAPVRVFVPHTASTDWLAEDGPREDYYTSIMAEAALWYGRVSPEVKSDIEEFGIQAEGKARRVAGVYGPDALAAEDAFLSYVGHLHRREAASGLDQIDQTVAPDGVTNKPTGIPEDVFDTFEDPVHPINSGVSGTETSERNPLIQEIEQAGGGQGQAEWPSQHGGSVALGYLYNMDDFLSAQAASGLDQIQQTVAPDGVTERPTPIPGEVAFPWLLGGPEVDPEAVPGGSPNEASLKEAGQKEAFLPLLLEALPAAAEAASAIGTGMAVKDAVDGDEKKEASFNFEATLKEGGSNFANDLASGEFLKDRRAQVQMHLQHNHFPPVPSSMVEPCLQALDAASSGDHDREIAMPPGVSYKGQDTAPAHVIINQHHLHPWMHDEEGFYGHEASKKTADMFGASDAPHAVPQPGVANSPATTPQPQQGGSYTAGFAAGLADAKNGDAATYADNSAGLPFSAGYVEGYGKGMAEVSSAQPQSVPSSLGGDNGLSHMTGSIDARREQENGDNVDCWSCGNVIRNGQDAYRNDKDGYAYHDRCFPEGKQSSKTASLTKVSDLFVTPQTRELKDFRKAYKFASNWDASKPLVKKGSAEFEAGLYAGISDNAPAQSAWVQAHAVQAAKYPEFSERISLHASFSGKVVASQGGDVEGPYIRTESATSTDLDTLAPGSTPSPVGETPLNGPGRPGPLAGQENPAAPGGPAPYNGVEPFGTPVVPTGVSTEPTGTSQLEAPVDDSGNLQSADRTLAFRNRVQAGLAAISN